MCDSTILTTCEERLTEPIKLENKLTELKCIRPFSPNYIEKNDMQPHWKNDYPYPEKNELELESDDKDFSYSNSIGVRWPPLGAPNDEEEASTDSELKWFNTRTEESPGKQERLVELESDQDQLIDSLLALTSHFAKVQFRLKQIVHAPPSEKQNLLLDLDEFASIGIPDIRQHPVPCEYLKSSTDHEFDANLERQREVMNQLKKQLEELEEYAYKTGEAGLPSSIVLKKQSIILDELKNKLNLNVDDFHQVPIDDLKHKVDHAVKQVIDPLKRKEKLVEQLQTQVVDLERYIEFMQEDDTDLSVFSTLSDNCKCNGHENRNEKSSKSGKCQHANKLKKRANSFRKQWEQEQMKRETESLVARVGSLLQMISFWHFGCVAPPPSPPSEKVTKRAMKNELSDHHWGDIRANLEIAIAILIEMCENCLLENTTADDFITVCTNEIEDNVFLAQSETAKQTDVINNQFYVTKQNDINKSQSEIAKETENRNSQSFVAKQNVNNKFQSVQLRDSRSSRLESQYFTSQSRSRSFSSQSTIQIIYDVIDDESVALYTRKKFSSSLRDLIQHGLELNENQSIVPFLGCIPHNFEGGKGVFHAWDLIVKYYHLKNGDQYNKTPARQLSQSFNLNINEGGAATTNKQLLLQTISAIMTSHAPFKRSHDSHFKAFVAHALNKKKLSTWLRLIFRTRVIVETYYKPWSYVIKTGFDDALWSLSRLEKFNFKLPTDIAIKPFQSIKDVFN